MYYVLVMVSSLGLRTSTLLCAELILGSSLLRCISTERPAVTWLMNVGAILNGIAGPVLYAGPSLMSVTWFPPKQRTTATAISYVAGRLGIALSNIVGPALVSQPWIRSNTSLVNTANRNTSSASNTAENLTVITNVQELRNHIMTFMYIECVAAIVLLMMVFIYFPAKPPTPPSVTASQERFNFLSGLRQLLTHKRCWLVFVAFGVPVGFNENFQSMLNLDLAPLHISQKASAMLGLSYTIGSCVLALLLSRFCDRFKVHTKTTTVIMMILATGFTVWFVLLRNGYIPRDIGSLYLSVFMLCTLISGAGPLFYELACELSYPIAEGVTVGAMVLCNNIAGSLLLSVQQIPKFGIDWINWALLFGVVLSVPLLLVLDMKHTSKDTDTPDATPLPDKPTDKH